MSKAVFKKLADSITVKGARITTFELTYNRFFHADVLTHRTFSRTASNTFAQNPSALRKELASGKHQPYLFGRSHPVEITNEISKEFYRLWMEMSMVLSSYSEKLQELGVSRYLVNKPLETFSTVKVVLTSTEWQNFFHLRDTKGLPEMEELVHDLRTEYKTTAPDHLAVGEWHLPYIRPEDKAFVEAEFAESDRNFILAMLSSVRCSNWSTFVESLDHKTIREEIEIGQDLYRAGHLNTFEHVATPWDVSSKVEELCRKNSSIMGYPIMMLNQITEHLSRPESVCPSWADVRNLRGWRSLRSFLDHKEKV